jgi:hypothetical protein
MPEWLLILLVIAGIFLLGVFFTAIGFVTNLARLLFLGLFVFLLILLTNRIFPAIESSLPDGTISPDGEFRLPRVDRDSELSESLREFGRSIDEFIFGPESTEPGTARSRDFVYPIPEPPSEPSTLAEQPAQPTQPAPASSPTQPTQPASRSTQVTDQSPLPALW